MWDDIGDLISNGNFSENIELLGVFKVNLLTHNAWDSWNRFRHVSLSREAVAENSDPTTKWSPNGYMILHLVGGFKKHLEKYESQIGKDDIPYMMENIQMFETTSTISSHPPSILNTPHSMVPIPY